MTGRCANCGTNNVSVIEIQMLRAPLRYYYCGPCYEAGMVSGILVMAWS